MSVSPLAYVHPDAKLGKDVVVEPFAYIAGDVEIGEGTYIGPNVSVLDGARIGKNCKIHSGAVVSGIPQDLKFKGEKTTAIIGDNTTLREFVTVNRGTASRGFTKVGSGCLLMAYVHVAHDCILGDRIILGNSTQLAGEVEIDDFAILSGGILVHQFEHIGSHVIIQGGSKVNKDVPPYVTAGREPLVFAGLNSIGLRRRNFSPEKIAEIHEIYRILYNRGLNVSQALEKIEQEVPHSPERDEIVGFIRNSKRGVIRAATSSSSSSSADLDD